MTTGSVSQLADKPLPKVPGHDFIQENRKQMSENRHTLLYKTYDNYFKMEEEVRTGILDVSSDFKVDSFTV
jgi:hypothetical protein